ncbi:MAG: rod-binding protein [Verrucomicrobia bacterium]|nr:rod-binding protein [Verrucomicrobiota bacterium]
MTNGVSTSTIAFMPALDRAALTARAESPQAAAVRIPKLLAACESFEAVFLSKLMRVMREGEPKDTLFGGSMAEGIYREMLDDQFADEMAKSGSTGIGRILYNSLEELELLAQAQRAGQAGAVPPEAGDRHVVMDADVPTEALNDNGARRMSP